MIGRTRISRRIRPLIAGAVFLFTFFLASSAYAGELKFGKEPLDVDDNGKLTAAGRKAAVGELANVPGEDAWMLHLWAKIDKGAMGPLYIEFFDQWQGKTLTVHREENSAYGGEKYVSMSFEISGNQGFNKDHTYTVKAVQVSEKGKDLVLATGKLKLTKVAAPESAEDEGSEDGEEEDELTEQDRLDSFAPEDEAAAGGDEPSTPPPIEPAATKKGCSVDPSQGGGAAGLAVLFVAGLMSARRRSA